MNDDPGMEDGIASGIVRQSMEAVGAEVAGAGYRVGRGQAAQ